MDALFNYTAGDLLVLAAAAGLLVATWLRGRALASPLNVAPWWWPSKDALLALIDRLTLSGVVATLLYGLFDPLVDNKDVFSLLTMIIGYYIGRQSTRADKPS